MVKSESKELRPENSSVVDKTENIDSNDLLDYLCRRVPNLTENADCYPMGEDLTVIFEDCTGSDFLELLGSVEDYGIDLENVQIHTDSDGWVAVDLIIG